MRRAFAVLLALLAVAPLFAASNKVALIYNKQTEVAGEAFKFLRTHLGYQIDTIAVGSSVNAADYRGLIVLNANVTQGLDPAIEKFVKDFSPKSKLILVSLYSRSTGTSVTVTTAAQSALGVDALSAATAWQEGLRGGTNLVLAMHEDWVKKVAAFLASR